MDSYTNYPQSSEPSLEVLRLRLVARLQPASGGCLVWTGARQSSGYGSIGVGRSKSALAHRVAWEVQRGPIPAGLTVDHLCRNKLCCEVAHLELVTRAENVRRGTQSLTHCVRGHSLELAKVRTDGRRRCVVCARIDGLSRRMSESEAVTRTETKYADVLELATARVATVVKRLRKEGRP